MISKSKKGFTLLELLIAIGLFSILVSIAAAGYINALRTDREVSALISAQSNAGLALEQIAREARTGYLFCHDVTNNTTPLASCGCTSAGGAVGPAIWTCSALDFYNADSEEVTYATSSGEIIRTAGGNTSAITADNVDIKSMQFILQGQTEGDEWNPRITILMQVVPSSTDPALSSDVLNLQTTVSAREIDCGAAAGC